MLPIIFVRYIIQKPLTGQKVGNWQVNKISERDKKIVAFCEEATFVSYKNFYLTLTFCDKNLFKN